jgi:hypothetical protein
VPSGRADRTATRVSPRSTSATTNRRSRGRRTG